MVAIETLIKGKVVQKSEILSGFEPRIPWLKGRDASQYSHGKAQAVIAYQNVGLQGVFIIFSPILCIENVLIVTVNKFDLEFSAVMSVKSKKSGLTQFLFVCVLLSLWLAQRSTFNAILSSHYWDPVEKMLQ